jgi:hypothetical protein
MILKSTLLAVVVFLGSLTVAEAQSYFTGGEILGWGTRDGWAYNHLSGCSTVSDAANTWHYAYFGAGGYIVTNNPGFAPLIGSACQSGNLFGLYAISFNPLVWTQIATFPFK